PLVSCPSWKWRRRFPRLRLRNRSLLRRRLVGNAAVSDLCAELGLQPTVLYRGQNKFSEDGAVAFEQKAGAAIRRTGTDRISWKRRSRPEMVGCLSLRQWSSISRPKNLWQLRPAYGGPHDVRDQVGGFRPALVGENRYRRRTVRCMAGRNSEYRRFLVMDPGSGRDG